MTADHESCLIAALKQRDRAAWSAAVERHLSEVYGFVFHLVGDRAVAEDLNQETWLEAINGIEKCDATRGTFRNWLFGIARNRVAGYYRRRGSGRMPLSLDIRGAEAGDLEALALLPEDVLEQVEQRAVVQAAMLLLPEDRRQVLLGKYVEGLSVADLVLRMKRSAKAVDSLLSRAREQLRGLLRGYMMPQAKERRVSKESSHE